MNKKFYISPSTALKICAAFSLLAAATSRAVIVTPTGPTDTNWTMSLYQTPLISTPTVQGKEWFAIQRDASNSGSAQAMYTGTDNQLGYMTGSVIMATANQSNAYGSGLILRSGSTSFADTNSYYLALIPANTRESSGNSTLGLYYGGGSSILPSGSDNSTWTLLTSVQLTSNMSNLAGNNAQYRLDFSFIGANLVANLYAWNGTNETQGSLLANLIYTETYTGVTQNALTSGYFGLRGGRYGGNVTSYFRNLEVVPEPTTVLLTLVGGAALFLRRRRMSKK